MMNRREAIAAVAAGVVTAAVSGAAAPPPPVRLPEGPRAVWKWDRATKSWARCRMDTLRPDDTVSVEKEPGAGRYIGRAESFPRYAGDGVCEIMFAGVLVVNGPGQHWLY